MRLQGKTRSTVNDDEDDEGVDEFLSNLGFEFVDASDGTPVDDRNNELLSDSKSSQFYIGI